MQIHLTLSILQDTGTRRWDHKALKRTITEVVLATRVCWFSWSMASRYSPAKRSISPLTVVASFRLPMPWPEPQISFQAFEPAVLAEVGVASSWGAGRASASKPAEVILPRR